MKKNIFKISAVLAFAAVLLAGCKKEELSTDQFAGDGSIVLSAFGPNPVYRGGTITFVGTNLENVAEVVIPGVDPLTDITVLSSGKPSKISVTVPVEGPEVGKITLKAKDGKTVSSACELTYTEPIVFGSFSPVNAMPGDIVTITGDYLNLVKEVVFGGDAISVDFKAQSRHELKVVVPERAITGKLTLGDANQMENPDAFANYYPSEGTLTIGNPTVSGSTATTYKAGQTLTVTGTYLCMVESVDFQAASVNEFEVSSDWKTLKVVIPAEAMSGDIKVMTYAGVSLAAGSMTLVAPSGLSAAPSPVKAGETLTISGNDLDLVTGLAFEGAGNADFTYTSNKITATVPAKATEGNVTLSIANGETFAVAYTLVHPVVTAVAPTELKAGETITVSGTDLDLITGVTLGGKAEEFAAGAEELVITTANTSVSGKIVLTLANGETVEPSEEITLSYDSFVITTYVPASAPIGGEVVLKGSNFNMVESIYIGEQKVTGYISRLDDEVHFIMPYNIVGTYDIRYVLFSGDEEVCPSQIEVTLEENVTIIWSGSAETGGYANNLELGTEDDWVNAGVEIGDMVKVFFTAADPTDWSMQIFGGHWGDQMFPQFNQDNSAESIEKGYISFEVTPEVYAKFTDKQNWGSALIVQGKFLTVSMISLTHFVPQEKTIFQGPVSLTWGDDGRFGLALSYFEDLNPGSQIIFYFKQTENWGQVQINDGWWGNSDMNFPEIGGAYITTDNVGGKDVTSLALTLTQEMLDHLKATPGDYFGLNTDYQGDGRVAMVIQGQDWIIEKITIL